MAPTGDTEPPPVTEVTPDAAAPEAAPPVPDAPPARPEPAPVDLGSAETPHPVDLVAIDLPPVPEPGRDAGPVGTDAPTTNDDGLAPGCPPAPAADEMIASFEDGSLKASAIAGRDATTWYLINTGSGASATLTVVEHPLRCGSRRHLRLAGVASPTQIPIARLLLLANSGFYDARARGYQGVRVTLRAASAAHVRVKLSDRNTATAGGVCASCSDHFGAEVDVPADWTTYLLPFSSLKQTGVGDPQPAVNAAALFGLEIVARSPAAFELGIDDVAFYR
jgi:hypothetical protein